MHRASLNHTYRLVWSDVESAFVAVAENVKGRGKSSRSGPALGAIALVAASALLAGASGQLGAQTLPATLPTGGNVVAGTGSIATSGNTLTVTQTSARMAADWQSFSIGAGNTVNFVQPSAASVALNRVLGSDVSVIQGALNANGQVFLVNPNGVLFSPTAQVNVGSIVASTLNLSTTDFMAGKYTFEGASSNAIVNQGRITATGDGGTGGTVALIAAKITNTGTLTANQGNVLLGAGTKVTLDLGGPVKLQVEQGAIDALIEQGGAIKADGGLVYLTAKAAGSLASSVINHTGVIEANSLSAKGGTIMLEADAITLGSGSTIAATGATGGGTVLVGGEWQGRGAMRQATTIMMDSSALIDVSATQSGNGGTAVLWSDIKKTGGTTRAYGEISAKGGLNDGNGGRIETSGHWLDVMGLRANASAQKGAAGQWLLDPWNVIIAGSGASGTAYGPSFAPGEDSIILASDIAASLNGGTSVTITTGTGGSSIGDITVASAITKTSGTADVTLTLRAANSIVVDQAISHTGGAGKLHVALDADNDNGTRDGGGIIILNNDISTGGGDITFGTGQTLDINGVSTKVGGDVYVAGSGARSLTTAGGAVTVHGEMLLANTSGLNISTSNGNVLFGGLVNSGNSYAGVSLTATWSDALTDATSGGATATGGTYLATITSRLENAVASRSVNYQPSWLGGRRVAGIGTDSQWRWVTGPEGAANANAGTPFFTQTGAGTGTTSSGLYANWSSGEPNNYNGTTSSTNYAQEGESVLQITGSLGRWNDLPGGPNPFANSPSILNSYAKETNLASSPLTVNAGTGIVTFTGAVGGSKALASLNVTSTGTIAINGGAVTTEGLQTYTGNVTLGAASTTLTQTTANTDFTLQAGKSITNAMGSAASLAIRTTGDIVGATGSSISSSSGALNITLNSDSDGTGAGGISLYGTTLNSNGGNITLGGGSAGDGSGYTGGLRTTANYNAGGTPASKVGIGIGNSTLSAAGGNISLRGQGYYDGTTEVTRAKGIELVGNTGADVSISTTGAGTITLDGRGGADTGGINYGVNFNNSTGNGTISVSSQTGAINVTGVAGNGGNNNNVGVKLEGGGTSSNLITSTSGAINITGTAGAAGSGTSGIDIAANSTIGGASTTGAITLTADTATLSGSYQSTGALTVKPLTAATTVGIAGGAGTLALTAANFSTNFVNGFSSITVGSATTGNITANGFTFQDNLTLWAGNANASATLSGVIANSGTGNSSGSLTVKAAGDISQIAGSSVTTQNQAVVFNSDSDATGGGAIWLGKGNTFGSGSDITISTNGGHITLSGGSDVTTGYAEGVNGVIGNGVTLDRAQLASAGGNILVRGKSSTTTTSIASTDAAISRNTNGIRLHGGNTIDAGSGTISLVAVAQGTNGSSNAIETNFVGYTKVLSSSTSTNAISFYGDATAGTSANGWGTFLWGTNASGILLAATGNGGGISLDGLGRNVSAGGGTHLEPNAFVLAASGPIAISGTKGATSTYEGIVINSTVGFASALPAGFGISSPVTASSSNISITTDTLSANRVFGGGSFGGSAVQSTGTLTIAPRTSGKALSVQTSDPGGTGVWINPTSMFGASGLFKTGFSKLVFGSATTGDVTLNNYTFDNDTELNTGGNAVLGVASIATKALTVNMNGSGSITNTGAVAVSKLDLNGSTSAATLANAGNAIGTLAANVASLALVNSTALTIGTVGAASGVTATGVIDVATLSGDLTVSQNVTTTDTSAAAILLNAGKSAAAGTSTGGNIVFSGSGSVAVGTGGRATLMTGSVSGSTGLTTLVGSGSGRFRYNSDEASPGYTAALGAGTYAIYREQPLLSVTPGTATSFYGDTPSLAGVTGSFTNAVNGDTIANTGTASFTTTALSTSNVGSYNIAYASGLSNSLGYGFADATGSTGEYTINQRPITVTASNQNRIYGNANPSSGAVTITSGSLVNSNTLGTATLTSTATVTTAAGQTAPLTPSAQAFTAGSAGNYAITYVDGTLTIDQRPITVTADAKTKVYGNVDPTLTYTINSGTLVGSDSLGTVTRAAGENAGDYTINAGALANSNYLITANDSMLTIDQRPITITADAKTKIVGTTDPALTYTAEAFAANRGLVSGEALSGQLSRASGETVGTFAIEQGTLTNANNTNYLIDYVPADLTVTGAATSAPTSEPVPAAQAAITLAQTAVADSVTGNPGSGAGQTTPAVFGAPAAQPSNLGGLTYIDVSGVPDTLIASAAPATPGTGSADASPVTASTGSTSADPAAPSNTGGRDAAGFMRVFVVSGGINLPPGLVNSTSDDSKPKTN